MGNSLPEIKKKIYRIREKKVMLDSDLAKLYRVETKKLNQQVKRNSDRFPEDFMFQLTKVEYENLRSQFVTSSSDYGGRRYLPYAFTELGIAMLSSVLNSEMAINVNIQIMRAFVKLREIMNEHTELHRQIIALERKYDRKFTEVFTAIKQLIEPAVKKNNPIGFE